MKMLFKAFAKKFFGAKYERLPRTLSISFMIFWGLYIADLEIRIAPFILYLMVSTFTMGVMWQALTSRDNACYMQNMFMLPLIDREFVFSYVAVLGVYTLITKTAVLLAVLLALWDWNAAEIFISVICAVHGVLITAAVFSYKKYWYAGIFWIFSFIAVILFLWNKPWFVILLIFSGTLAVVLLHRAQAYSFYFGEEGNSHGVKGYTRYSMQRYFFRYLKYHRNYLMNTLILWCGGCALPLFWGGTESIFLVPIGFAVLSLNTPICILLSCDPALEQAVRFLPGQKKGFCIPYCMFIFLCNIAANVIFLCSLEILMGCVSFWMIPAALFFALQSALFSVLLEWFYPVRDYKIESDLWHHPRKYIVPSVMLFFGGILGTLPMVLPALIILLAAEIVILLYKGARWLR